MREYRRPCVRCGTRDRKAEIFLCGKCLDDPVTQAEIDQAIARDVDGRAQRLWLVGAMRWYGHWSTRE